MGTNTSINEILEASLENILGQNYVDEYSGSDKYIAVDEIASQLSKDLKTALYTLIASVRPEKYNNWSDVPDKAVGGLPSYTKKRAYQKAHNTALQDYDNAIKEVLK